MKKFSSILPSNSRLTTVDLNASPSRRPGSYNPFTGQVEKSAVKPIKPPAMEPIKLDKVSFSPEAEALNNNPKAEAITKTHTKYKGYA